MSKTIEFEEAMADIFNDQDEHRQKQVDTIESLRQELNCCYGTINGLLSELTILRNKLNGSDTLPQV